MRRLDGTDLQKSALTIGRKLGTGGQGEVYELQGPWTGYVYKEYLSPGVNGDALTRLVTRPGQLTSDERDHLLQRTAWPLARVLDGAQVRGFLMQRVPSAFWGTAPSGPRLRELQFLLYEPKALWGDIVPVDASGRLAIVRQTASLFFLLHSKNLVVGDVSMLNFLWSPSPLGIFLLDCDGIRELGSSPVLPQPDTPDWNDPQQPLTGPDLDTDRYKLALIITRVLTKNPALRPGEKPAFVPDLPARVVTEVSARFAEAGGLRGVRPDAAQWIRALDDRGQITLPPLPPVRKPPNLPTVPLERQRGQRSMIRLPPNDHQDSRPTEAP